MSQVVAEPPVVAPSRPRGRARQGRARAPSGALLHRHGRRAARGDDVQRPGRRIGRRVRGAGGVPRRHGRADDLLHRLHRDVAPGDVDRRLLHVHLARAGQRHGPRRGDPDRALLRHLRRGGDRRRCGYFASTTIDDWFGVIDARLRLHVRRAGADDRLRLVPHRADGEDPRRRARRRGAGAAGHVRRHHRQRRRPGRLQRRAAEPGQPLRQRRRAAGLRRRRGRRRASSARSGPGSASRWRPTTPRSRASRSRSPRRRPTAR